MFVSSPGLILLVASVITPSSGQTVCENYGESSGSACTCPPGFGGSTCSSPACGGNIFQGTNRSIISDVSATTFGNLTSSGCSCEDGWMGTGCNVCKSTASCQNAYTAVNGTSSSSSGVDGLDGSSSVLNSTLTCNSEPQIWAAGEMSCQVVNPTLQAIYPLDSTLTILRTLNTSLTASQGLTSFGSSGSIYAQLWYSGIEQFYCTASSCTQTSPSGNGSSTWSCLDLSCTCRPNTTFCGGVPLSNLTDTIDGLSDDLTIGCGILADNRTSTCSFQQSVLTSLFGSGGLSLSDCVFGECVAQGVIDSAEGTTTSGDTSGGGTQLSPGLIAGLAVVGGLVGLVMLGLMVGLWNQRKVRGAGEKGMGAGRDHGGVAVQWRNLRYVVPGNGGKSWYWRGRNTVHDQVVLDGMSGKVAPGQMMGILGPSGAGKTTLVEILSERHKSGIITGSVLFPSSSSSSSTCRPPRIGFVPQQDILPATLTVFEALLFAARLRLPEHIYDAEKKQRVEDVIEQLGIANVRDVRIGGTSGEGRGISGGEMRRVSIGLELVASPDVLILDEPTSGLDSVSASKVASVLRAVAHDSENPTAVIASIHQPSSQLYQTFDKILLLSHGQALYNGPGSLAPAQYFTARGIPCQEGYNVADYLLEIASDSDLSPSSGLVRCPSRDGSGKERSGGGSGDVEKGTGEGLDSGMVGDINGVALLPNNKKSGQLPGTERRWMSSVSGQGYPTTFLTQFEVLAGREWKILRRDKTLFFAHVGISCVLGVFCGGLYFHTGLTIAGFQSRVGCLFFLGALIAFSSLSALYNVVEIRPLFLRERSSGYYSPTAWLFSRFVFDVIPLRIIPTILVSTITYWMAGLAPHAANFFKFLFILVLYTLAMTLFNFLLATLLRNGGLAILLSALSALYQMTYAGFFVHLSSIPPVLRWLQWLCPLKYTLEALSVNEVDDGLMIVDELEGVPVDVSAEVIMELLFGFGTNNYYRDVLVLFAFIAGFAVLVVGVVWIRVREMR